MTNKIPLITMTTDFGAQSQGVGIMEAVVFSIAPHARVIHLMHGLPGFNILAAARTMETINYIPVGYHICVCDPGVGTQRKAIVCNVKRGDYLIGPDNGVLMPAARMLGGILQVHEITNPKYMLEPVSPIFHGRDIFAPTAAHLTCGVSIEDLGPRLDVTKLIPAPYEDAIIFGSSASAQVIHVNKFGSIHLNITYKQWEALSYLKGNLVRMRNSKNNEIKLKVTDTFGDVPVGHNLIMKDDYGRVEVAQNCGSFVQEYPVEIGESIKLLLL